MQPSGIEALRCQRSNEFGGIPMESIFTALMLGPTLVLVALAAMGTRF